MLVHMCGDFTHAHMAFILHLDTSVCERMCVYFSSYSRERSSKMYILSVNAMCELDVST